MPSDKVSAMPPVQNVNHVPGPYHPPSPLPPISAKITAALHNHSCVINLMTQHLESSNTQSVGGHAYLSAYGRGEGGTPMVRTGHMPDILNRDHLRHCNEGHFAISTPSLQQEPLMFCNPTNRSDGFWTLSRG
jgi:hypothetical protein